MSVVVGCKTNNMVSEFWVLWEMYNAKMDKTKLLRSRWGHMMQNQICCDCQMPYVTGPMLASSSLFRNSWTVRWYDVGYKKKLLHRVFIQYQQKASGRNSIGTEFQNEYSPYHHQDRINRCESSSGSPQKKSTWRFHEKTRKYPLRWGNERRLRRIHEEAKFGHRWRDKKFYWKWTLAKMQTLDSCKGPKAACGPKAPLWETVCEDPSVQSQHAAGDGLEMFPKAMKCVIKWTDDDEDGMWNVDLT